MEQKIHLQNSIEECVNLIVDYGDASKVTEDIDTLEILNDILTCTVEQILYVFEMPEYNEDEE